MKRLIAASLALCAPFLFPFTASAASVDDAINEVMGPVTDAITSVIFWTVDIAGFTVPFVLIWLFVGEARVFREISKIQSPQIFENKKLS